MHPEAFIQDAVPAASLGISFRVTMMCWVAARGSGSASRVGARSGIAMGNLNPLKYCFHGQHSRPRATFRTLPGVRNKRAVCAECYEKIIADRKQKKLAAATAAR